MAGVAVADRVRRVTDLFVTGSELVLDDGSATGTPVLIWVQKPNAFDKNDTRRSAQTARDLRKLGLGESSPELVAIKQGLADRPREEIVEGIVGQFETEDVVLARQDVMAQEDFAETANFLAEQDLLTMDGRDPDSLSDEETSALAAANQEWLVRYNEAKNQRHEARVEELAGASREELEEHYLDAYRDIRGMEAFHLQYDAAQIWRAARDCQATANSDGSWNHVTCNHGRLLFDNVAAVMAQPDLLLEGIRGELARDLTDLQAGKSDAPASSSASSEQPSAEAVSTPSGQAV